MAPPDLPRRRDHDEAARTDVPGGNPALTLLAALAVIFVLDRAQALLIPLALGILLSYALAPLVRGLARWHVPRAIGAGLVLLAMVGALGTAAYSLNDEAALMIERLPDAAKQLRQTLRKEWGDSRDALKQVQKAAAQIERAAVETAAGAAAPTPARGVTRVQIEEPTFDVRDYLWNGTLGAASFVSLGVLVLFFSYFLLISADVFRRKLVRLSGPTLSRKRTTVEMLDDVAGHIQRYLLVQVFTSVVVGVASWLAFLAVGLEHAAVWGVIAGVLNFIPYVGAIVTVAATAVAGFLQFGTLGMGLWIGAISLLINTLEGYLLTPWLTGRAGRMNGVVVFAGLMFWGWIWGAWGLLLGMPILMAVKSVCDHSERFRAIGELMGE